MTATCTADILTYPQAAIEAAPAVSLIRITRDVIATGHATIDPLVAAGAL